MSNFLSCEIWSSWLTWCAHRFRLHDQRFGRAREHKLKWPIVRDYMDLGKLRVRQDIRVTVPFLGVLFHVMSEPGYDRALSWLHLSVGSQMECGHEQVLSPQNAAHKLEKTSCRRPTVVRQQEAQWAIDHYAMCDKRFDTFSVSAASSRTVFVKRLDNLSESTSKYFCFFRVSTNFSRMTIATSSKSVVHGRIPIDLLWGWSFTLFLAKVRPLRAGD